MDKLFDDTLFIQKERPTKITKQQEEKMFIDLAKEVITILYKKITLSTFNKCFSYYDI